jgi:Protein of unknwon function (DUF3310)
MSDSVHSPKHYQGRGGLEAIDAIEAAFGLDGHAPTAMKYILRHQAKGRPAEDLAKAKWYVDRLIAAKGRAARQPALSFDRFGAIADAFAISLCVREALILLLDAVACADEREYRSRLRDASRALGVAIVSASRRAQGAPDGEAGHPKAQTK